MATRDPRPVSTPPAPDVPDVSAPPSSSVPARAGDGAPVFDEKHQLPAHKGKVGRVADHARGLVDDLTEWAELRVNLVKEEVEQKIDTNKEKAQFGVVIGVFAALAGLFLLIALGFGASAIFAIWVSELVALLLGFLVVTLVLGLIAFVAFKKSPFDHPKEVKDELASSSPVDSVTP